MKFVFVGITHNPDFPWNNEKKERKNMKLKDSTKNGMTTLVSGELFETRDLAAVVPEVEVELTASGASNGNLCDYSCALTFDQLCDLVEGDDEKLVNLTGLTDYAA
jgi:hypothetical protein